MADPVPPGLPLSAGEATTAMVHYYRAEMARMASWRSRLDQTTNWAITVVAAMLSVSLSTTTAHHGVLLFAMVLVSLLLYVEGRRYRFYDVYRQRVRQFERHYFSPLFSATAEGGAEPWLAMLAQDLRHPRFRVSLQTAITRRLRRNYIWMYLILLLAWILKIASPQLQEGVTEDTRRPLARLVDGAALGPVPGWIVIVLIFALYVALVIFVLRARRRRDDDEVQV